LNYKKWLSFCSIFLIFIIGFTIVVLNLGYSIEPKSSPLPNPSECFLPVAASRMELPFSQLLTFPPPVALSSATSAPSITHSEGIKVNDNYSSELTSIDWGTITLGVTKNTQISVLNIGDKPVILYLSAINWTPGVNGTITWNYNDEAVLANATVSITLSLNIESANVTAFNNNIIVGFTTA
jgi:hypothetical protein